MQPNRCINSVYVHKETIMHNNVTKDNAVGDCLHDGDVIFVRVTSVDRPVC